MKNALLVGAGGMGRAWAQNLQTCDGVRLAGWVDIRDGAASEAAMALGAVDIYTGTDLVLALETVKPDFVVDVTVPEAHCAVTLAALEFGVPVLGEKPMATSLDEARRMVVASERAGKLSMVSQSRRYHAGLAAFRRLIARETGPVGILNADFYLAPRFGGFRDAMASPLLLDMAIHTFDQARYLTGADPVSVYCEEFNPAWSWYKGDASATALFTMTGGLRFAYRGCWSADGCQTSWEADWRAVGPQGTAKWPGEGAPHWQADDSAAKITETVEPDIPGGIDGSLRDFLRALETGETPMGECHDNIKSLAMVFAAIKSSQTGQRVAVEW